MRWRPAEGAGIEHCQVTRNTRILNAVVTPDHGLFDSGANGRNAQPVAFG